MGGELPGAVPGAMQQILEHYPLPDPKRRKGGAQRMPCLKSRVR